VNISFLVLKGLPFPGGIERYMEAVGPRLSAKGHDVRVYSISYRTSVPSSYAGMEICTVPAVPSKNLEKPSAALLAALWAAVDRAEIVHVHSFGQSLFGILPRLAGKKVVIQGHGIEWRRSKWSGFARAFLRFSEWSSVYVPHAVTVVSRAQRQYMRERYGMEASFIPPGVAPASAAAPEEIKKLGLSGGDYILFAARMEKEKGLHYLIDAYRALDPKMKLVVAGDNPLDGTYKAAMHTLAAGHPRILFTGFATGRLLRELFSNCYAFALPSELEGLPLAVLEAMSYGCACLVSDIPENKEAIDGHGITFRNGDAHDLARQLRSLIDSPERVKAIGSAARSHVAAQYSWDQTVLGLEDLYQSLLGRSRQQHRQREPVHAYPLPSPARFADAQLDGHQLKQASQ